MQDCIYIYMDSFNNIIPPISPAFTEGFLQFIFIFPSFLFFLFLRQSICFLLTMIFFFYNLSVIFNLTSRYITINNVQKRYIVNIQKAEKGSISLVGRVRLIITANILQRMKKGKKSRLMASNNRLLVEE